MTEPQTCSNGHPCDNSGRCRVSDCPFSKHPWEPHFAVPHEPLLARLDPQVPMVRAHPDYL